MKLKFFLFLLLINAIEYHAYMHENYVLNAALKRTSYVFKTLKLDHGSEDLNENVTVRIDETVTEHVRNISKIILSRRKRDLLDGFKKGVNILNGLQDFIQLNFENARDVRIFSLQNGYESTWFSAILDVFGVSVFRINRNVLYRVTTYPVTNGTQLIVNKCNYGALLIVRKQDDTIRVLRFVQVSDKYYVQPIQDFESNALTTVTHLTVWNGMNQLYLGIASQSSISIFSWFGDYFDLIQVINLGSKQLVPFQSKGFMYLAATGSVTLIFKHFLKSNEFLVMQSLPSSEDASFFQLREGHFTDNYLCLSTGSSVVIYKDTHGRFVPFQRISSGRSTVEIVSNRAVVFFALQEDTALAYQYDGWRFIELDVRLHGIRQLEKADLYEEQLLMVKYKNGTWVLKRLTWTKRKSYKDVQEEIRAWNIKAKNVAERKSNEISNSNSPIRILKGHIDQLFVHDVNRHNSHALKDVSERYNKVRSKLRERKVVVANNNSGNLTVTSLRAKKIQMKCKTKCRVNKLNVKGNTDLLSKLKALPNRNEVSRFKVLKVKEMISWKCPILSLSINNITADRSINGMLLENLQRNTLKVTGNQTVSGKHSFNRINVTNASMPLNVALHFVKNEIQARRVKVKELTLTEGGILLPLNGLATVISGAITAPKVTVKDVIRLQGPVTGSWANKFSPIKYISESIVLKRNVNFENARIESLRSTDLIDNKTGSVKDILSNAITLYDNVPVSLIFSSEKTEWNNVTIHGSRNWASANRSKIVYGKKHIRRNVEITKRSYENLTFPWIETAVCGASVIVRQVKVSVLTIDDITVESLKSLRAFGNLGDESLFKPFRSSVGRYYNNVKAKSVFATGGASNINLASKELQRFVNSWLESNIFNISAEATDLKISVLRSPVKFYAELSKVIRNVVSKENAYVGDINNINFTDFLADAVKLEDIISLRNVTFDDGFAANYIRTSHSPLPLMQTRTNLNLYGKEISGNIETNTINLPYSYGLEQNDTPINNIIIKGSARFSIEPIIRNINENELKELFARTWITRNSTTFHGKNLRIINASIKGNVALNNSTNTLHLGSWKIISERVLSRTRVQTIIVDACLNIVETSGIVGSNASTILSSTIDFNDMFNNSLTKGRAQSVTAKWTFDKLQILGKMNARKTINKVNLKTDVMRHDTKRSIVMGKKTIVVLTTKNLNGLNFVEWVDGALISKGDRLTIKGRKNFVTVSFNDITLSGTIMGHAVNETLLKSTNQTIHGRKIIYGSIRSSAIVIDGLVNDVNLTSLINDQLKKQSSLQRIEREIELQKGLIITGNLIVNDTYGGADAKNLKRSYFFVPSVTEKMNGYSKLAETINLALRDRAAYINKLEVVKNITSSSRKGTILETDRCKVKNFSKYCVNEHIENIVFQSNASSSFILIKSISLEDNEFVVWIKFHFVSIYEYNNRKKNLVRVKGLHMPGIIDAFVEPMFNSLWIALRLTSQTLLLHYQPWQEVREYVLPATDVFALSRSPNNQLLLFLSDGVYDLKGLASPRNIIEIPFRNGQVETFVDAFSYFVKYTGNNKTVLTKARYVGN